MSIFRKIAVRIIPTAALAFLVFAAVAYQRGAYDFTFIERETTASESSGTEPITEKPGDTSVTDAVPSSDSQNVPPVDPPKTDPVTDFLNSLDSSDSAMSRGFCITDDEYGDFSILTRMEPSIAIENRYSLRKKTIQTPERVPDEVYSGYTTKLVDQEVDRPLVDVYMDYVVVDNGTTVTLLNADGTVLAWSFDLDVYQPLYSRSRDDIAQFYEIVQPAKKNAEPYAVYYQFVDGEFIESDYEDAADNRGIYINYPTYYGKSDTKDRVYFDGELYGYGTAPTAMKTRFRYTRAFNFREGVACVCDESGVLSYVQSYFYNKITGTSKYVNLSGRRVFANYYAPDTFGIESLGFFYFDRGLCRVRKREIDAFHYEFNEDVRTLTDVDIVIRSDGTEFPVPSDYEVAAYSCGVLLLKRDGYYGYMDYTGRWIAQPEYTYAEPFSEGLAVLGKEGKVGMIDTAGNTVVPFVFDHIGSASGGIIPVYDSTNGWALLNKMN